MIAIPIPIQTPHAPDGPVFDYFFFHLATSRGNPGGFWNDPGRDSCGPLRTVEQSPRKRESGSFHENRLPPFGNPGVATT